MFGLGFQELLIIGIIAVLLFGKRLPEVAKNLGRSYHQFRKGLSDIQAELDVSSTIDSAGSTYNGDTYGSSAPSYDAYDDRDEPTAPKFEPPPAEPQETQVGVQTREPAAQRDAQSGPRDCRIQEGYA